MQKTEKKDNIENINKNTVTVMPFNIRIMEYLPPREKMYDEYHNILLDNRRFIIPPEDYEKMMPVPMEGTELNKVYCDARSMSSINDVVSFLEKNPKVRLLDFSDHPFLEFITEDYYYKSALEHIRAYNMIYDYVAFRKESKGDFERQHTYLIDSFKIPRTAMGYFDYSFAFSKKNVEDFLALPYRILGNRKEVIRVNYNELGLVTDVVGDISQEDKDKILSVSHKSAMGQFNARLDDKLKEYTRDNRLLINSDTGIIEYWSPTLISALFSTIDVFLFNENEYALCANKKCHNYFKVNKSHPQKRCEIHMKYLRKKRENAKKKETDDDKYGAE